MKAFIILLRRGWAPPLLAAVAVLWGCAARGPLLTADQLHIDKVESARAAIGAVYVRRAGNGILVEGEVSFDAETVGSPRDRLSATLIDPAGKVLHETQADYFRHGTPSIRSDSFDFTLAIPMMPPAGSTLRLSNQPPPNLSCHGSPAC